MANKRWLGRAGAVAEVNTITIALTWAAGDTITVTINAKDLLVTIGTLVTTAQVATTLKQAWEGETFTDTTATVRPSGGGPDFTEYSEITATVSGSVVTLTGDTAGVPWNVNSGMAVTEVTAGTGTATLANATAATGPNFASDADNWSPTGVPGAADDLWFDNSDVSVLYGLDGISGTLTSCNVARSYIGTIGLPATNASGYPEYRLTYFDIDCSAITIGYGEGSGSGRIKINSGSVQTALLIESTGSPAEVGIGAVVWNGTHASNTLRLQDGSVSISAFNGEPAALLTAEVTNGTLENGAGFTAPLGTLTIQAGNVTMRDNVTTVTIADGTLTLLGTATVTTLNLDGGTFIHKSSGAITTAQVTGLLDASQDNSSRTITTCNLKRGGSILDPLRTITFSNGIARASDVRQGTRALKNKTP